MLSSTLFQKLNYATNVQQLRYVEDDVANEEVWTELTGEFIATGSQPPTHSTKLTIILIERFGVNLNSSK